MKVIEAIVGIHTEVPGVGESRGYNLLNCEERR
jgi:hypothetical protein